MEPKDEFDRAWEAMLAAFGNQGGIADALAISRQAVSRIKKRRRIPHERVHAISAAAESVGHQIPPSKLRPDLWPESTP